MGSFFRKLLGIILLLSTVSLSTCQSMINTMSENSNDTEVEQTIGDL